MSENITLNEVASRFVAMPIAQRLLFLATYAFQITILERGHFADKNYELARQCNESLHRLAGYMASSLRSPEAAADASFINMLVQGATQKGWSEILVRSLQMSPENESNLLSDKAGGNTG